MTYRTDDPIADFHRWDDEQQKQLEKLPKCKRCNHHIQQEDAVCIDGEYYCDTCLDGLRESIGDD